MTKTARGALFIPGRASPLEDARYYYHAWLERRKINNVKTEIIIRVWLRNKKENRVKYKRGVTKQKYTYIQGENNDKQRVNHRVSERLFERVWRAFKCLRRTCDSLAAWERRCYRNCKCILMNVIISILSKSRICAIKSAIYEIVVSLLLFSVLATFPRPAISYCPPPASKAGMISGVAQVRRARGSALINAFEWREN